MEDPRHEAYPKVVSWIHPKEPRPKVKTSDLLTPQEVKKLMAATPDLRMKALVDVCYECGLRIGEALNLKIGDVHLEEQYASLTVSGKTGSRPAYSIRSLPLLLQWLDQHPDKDNPEAWLWTENTDPLTYDRARFKLLQMKKKVRIHKRLYFHLFRHSSATANADLGEPMLRKIYGWSKNSDEPGTYVHLSGQTAKKALLEKHGIQKKAEEPAIKFCPRCGSPNQLGASLCVKCKSALTLKDAISVNELHEKIGEMKEELDSLRQTIETYARPEFRGCVLPSKESLKVGKQAAEILHKHGYTVRT